MADKNNMHINSLGFDSTQPINNIIKIRDLVLSSIWTRLNFSGLGGVKMHTSIANQCSRDSCSALRVENVENNMENIGVR